MSHPFDNAFQGLRDQLGHSNIVLEEEGSSAAGQDIVYAVVYQVHAYSIMLIQGTGNLQLCAHPIRAGGNNRLLISLELKEPTKKTEVTYDLGGKRGTCLFVRNLYYSVGSIDVHTCFSIGSSLSTQKLLLERLQSQLIHAQLHRHRIIPGETGETE